VSVPTNCSIPLLDLREQFREIEGEVMESVHRVFAGQRFILGEEVEQLEQELARYCGVPYAIGCASGTDALYLSLLALDLKPGDEVVTVPYTFFATAGAIHRAGARPVFTDIDPDTFQMDPAKLEETLGRRQRVRAIIPVHLFGACAPMDAINTIAARHGAFVIEDAAQAIGAEFNHRRAGSLGGAGCFSFFPSKNLGGAGDGGLLTTDDEQLARRLRALRVHGSEVRYYHEEVGINSRLDALQAAILRVKLRHLDRWTRRRQQHAAFYLEALAGLPLQLPATPEGSTRHVWNQFVIRAEARDKLRAFLSDQGIGTEMYYPLPLHLQNCFRDLGYREGDFPVSEAVSRQCIALPVYAELTGGNLEHVAASIRDFYNA
jgi:dTDP-4-amino-4,6-dideoxygalactose transaminase